MLRGSDVIESPGKENALALGQALRLDNVCPSFPFWFRLEVGFELGIIARETPCEREVAILLRKLLAHPHKILGEKIFSRECVHAGEMVDLLVVLHFHQHFGRHCPVRPPDVPLGVVRVVSHLPFEFLSDTGHHLVAAICTVQYVPATFITIRSNRIICAQFAANFGGTGSTISSSCSSSSPFSRTFLFIIFHIGQHSSARTAFTEDQSTA